MRRGLSGLFSLLLIVVLVAACRNGGHVNTANTSQSASDSTVHIVLAAAPKLGDNIVNVQVNQGDEGVDGATVHLIGNMSMAGMQPVTALATEQKPGLYVAQGFHFTMAGAWVITADVTLPDGHKISQDLKVSVPGT